MATKMQKRKLREELRHRTAAAQRHLNKITEALEDNDIEEVKLAANDLQYTSLEINEIAIRTRRTTT